MQTVGAVALDLNLNEKGFNSQLKSIGNMAKKVGATIAGAFAIKKGVDFGKDCIELGSDLTEVQNVVDVAFPKMNKTIEECSRTIWFIRNNGKEICRYIWLNVKGFWIF